MADDGTLHSLTTIRSKKGCQTCRNRKKKCDEVHPECGGCVRNSLLCQWPIDTSQPQRPRRRRRHQNGRLWPSGIDIPQGMDAMVVVFAVPSRQMLCRLLSHFTQFSPQWMSISPGRRRNQFLRHVMPLALENPLTLNCMLAASAADLMKYDIEQPELKTIALELYGKSLAGLSAAVSRELAHGPSIKAHGPASGGILIDTLHEL